MHIQRCMCSHAHQKNKVGYFVRIFFLVYYGTGCLEVDKKFTHVGCSGRIIPHILSVGFVFLAGTAKEPTSALSTHISPLVSHLTSHLSPLMPHLTSHLPLTFPLSPLTSHRSALSPLTSHLSHLTSHL